MSGTECQICKQSSAAFCCSCEVRAFFVCTLCLSSHTARSAAHLFFPLPQSPPTSPLCDVCCTLAAQEICSCQFPLVAYCPACKIGHLSQSQSTISHIFLPMSQRPLIQSGEELAKVAQYRLIRTLTYEKLKRNIDTIEKCEKAVINRCADVQVSLDHFVEQKAKSMDHLRKITSAAIEAGLAEAKVLLADPENPRKDGTGGLVAGYMQNKDKDLLVLFRCKEQQEAASMEKLFALDWESRLGPEETVSAVFPLENTPAVSSPIPSPLDFASVEGFLAACPRQPTPHLRLLYYRTHFTSLQAFHLSHLDTRHSMNLDRPEEFWTSQGVCQLLQRTQGQAPALLQQSLSRLIAHDYSLLKEATNLRTHNAKLQALIASGPEVQRDATVFKRKRGRKPKNFEGIKRPKSETQSPPSDLEDLLDKD